MFKDQRKKLVEKLSQNGIHDKRVLDAIALIPRELFIATNLQKYAYEDKALAIDCDQTISQPYIIALMTQVLTQNSKLKTILEIGTGSGYQTAILAKLFHHVYSIERIEQLFQASKKTLKSLHINNVTQIFGDGFEGLDAYAPYDGIIVTAAPNIIPAALLGQLNNEHGTMVLPIGDNLNQKLKVITKINSQYSEHEIENVRFVPMLKGTLI